MSSWSAESAELESVAIAATNALRRQGLVAEALITGSPRKRFDKAQKLNPAQIYSLSYRDGQLHKSQRGAGASQADLDRVSAIVDAVIGASR